MKKYACHAWLLFSLTLVSVLSQAQIKQGATLLEGNFALSTTSDNTIPASGPLKTTSIQVNPYFGKAIKQDLIVGFDLQYLYSRQDNINATANSFGAGIFIRKYKYLGSHFYLFLQAQLNGGYSIQQQQLESSNLVVYVGNTRITSVQLGINPGISYAVNDKWHLEATLPNVAYVNYTHSKTTSQPASAAAGFTENSFDLASSLTNAYTLSVGVSFQFNR